MACAISAPSGTHGSRAANTDAPLAVSLDKFKDKAKNFEPTDDKAASNSRLVGAHPCLIGGFIRIVMLWFWLWLWQWKWRLRKKEVC